jgi:hypothetical protein
MVEGCDRTPCLDVDLRHAKRHTQIKFIKETPHYEAALWYKAVRQESSVRGLPWRPFPILPDPTDHSISRRTWEDAMMRLRHAFKEMGEWADQLADTIPTMSWLGGPEWRLEVHDQ